MKKTALLLTLAGISMGTFAQMEPGQANAPEAFVKTENTISEKNNIRDMINNFLNSKGWNEGKNTGKDGKTFFIAVGTGTIDAARDNRAYISSRVIAFNKAMMAAKRDMTEFIKNDIKSDTEKTVAEKNNSEEGTFCKIIETESNQYILGMQVLNSFEFTPTGKNGQIGVVTVWSSKLQHMAEAISSGKMIDADMPKKPLDEQISTDPMVLMTTFGVQQKLDEKGNLVLISFGQDGALRDTDRAADAAVRKAQLNAQAAIREFAGESVAVSSLKAGAENIKEFNEAAREYSNDSAFGERIKTVAEKMETSGISTFKRWQGKHPVSGQTVYGVICVWSPELSAQAKALGASMKTSTGSPSLGKAQPAKVDPGKSFRGAGQNADADAF